MQRDLEVRQFSCSCLVIILEPFGEGPMGLASTDKDKRNQNSSHNQKEEVKSVYNFSTAKTPPNMFELKGRASLRILKKGYRRAQKNKAKSFEHF